MSLFAAFRHILLGLALAAGQSQANYCETGNLQAHEMPEGIDEIVALSQLPVEQRQITLGNDPVELFSFKKNRSVTIHRPQEMTLAQARQFLPKDPAGKQIDEAETLMALYVDLGLSSYEAMIHASIDFLAIMSQ